MDNHLDIDISDNACVVFLLVLLNILKHPMAFDCCLRLYGEECELSRNQQDFLHDDFLDFIVVGFSYLSSYHNGFRKR